MLYKAHIHLSLLGALGIAIFVSNVIFLLTFNEKGLNIHLNSMTPILIGFAVNTRRKINIANN